MTWSPRPELADRSVLLLAENDATGRALSDGCHLRYYMCELLDAIAAKLLLWLLQWHRTVNSWGTAALVGNLKACHPLPIHQSFSFVCASPSADTVHS